MTQSQKLLLRLGNDGNELTEMEMEDLLDSAKNIILSRRFPLSAWPMDENGETYVEARYKDLQVRIAVELFSKRGAEGETTHNEGTVQRTYDSAGVSLALLKEIVPMAVLPS
ncbi:MAG: hypothetical protein Q4F79_12570 [Eubacteriales bacterium]|nr:hypothetical protein [Eubacteriales bacterium]